MGVLSAAVHPSFCGERRGHLTEGFPLSQTYAGRPSQTPPLNPRLCISMSFSFHNGPSGKVSQGDESTTSATAENILFWIWLYWKLEALPEEVLSICDVGLVLQIFPEIQQKIELLKHILKGLKQRQIRDALWFMAGLVPCVRFVSSSLPCNSI